jgi:hypothetical protein
VAIVAPFQGLIPPTAFDPQGVALGWFVPAFQAEERKTGYAQINDCLKAALDLP